MQPETTILTHPAQPAPSPEKIYRLALEMIVANPEQAKQIAAIALLEGLNG